MRLRIGPLLLSWTPMLCANDVIRRGIAWKIGRTDYGGWHYLPLWRL